MSASYRKSLGIMPCRRLMRYNGPRLLCWAVTATTAVMLATLFLSRPGWLVDCNGGGSGHVKSVSTVPAVRRKRNSRAVSLEYVAERFRERRERLRQACRRLNVSSSYPGLPPVARRFVYPTNSSPVVLYCPAPKTGTTYLRRIMGYYNNMHNVNWVQRFFVRPVDDYDKAVMFFFTREPYSRMFSSYVDKLWSPNLYFWRVLGTKVIQLTRPNATQAALKCGSDVTFPEFVRYFIDGQRRHIRVNTHIVPTNKFCEVCKYDYDFIGKMETFQEDLSYILPAINMTLHNNHSNEDIIIAERIDQAFYTFNSDKNLCVPKEDLLHRAWRALQIQGLISMDLSSPAPENARTLNKRRFSQLVYEHVHRTKDLFHRYDSPRDRPEPHRLAHETTTSTSDTGLESEQKQKQFLFRFETVGQSESPDKSRDCSVLWSGLKARDRQKKMATASAYSLVPLAERFAVMEFLREEFELFDYEARPEHVFDKNCPWYPKLFDIVRKHKETL